MLNISVAPRRGYFRRVRGVVLVFWPGSFWIMWGVKPVTSYTTCYSIGMTFPGIYRGNRGLKPFPGLRYRKLVDYAANPD